MPSMPVKARLAHINLVAGDWRRLAEFYKRVFGFVPVPPERDLRGQWLDDATGLAGAEVHGVHLRLPGRGDQAPTLEIFQYNRQAERQERGINRPGLAHIAFAVEDVGAARDAVMAAGGGSVGELVSARIAGAGEVTFVYVTDPEGNIIELQHWSD